MNHFDMRRWNERGRELVRELKWSLYEQDLLETGHWSEWYLKDDKPAVVIARHRGKDLHLLIKPERDLFFLDRHDFDFDWTVFADNFPYPAGYGALNHLAVEFDASWYRDLPRYFDKLLTERSPRGFIARAVVWCYNAPFGFVYTEMTSLFFWLVDRGIHPKATTRHQDCSSMTATTSTLKRITVLLTTTKLRSSAIPQYTSWSIYIGLLNRTSSKIWAWIICLVSQYHIASAFSLPTRIDSLLQLRMLEVTSSIASLSLDMEGEEMRVFSSYFEPLRGKAVHEKPNVRIRVHYRK
jgi:hypothetical protein